MVRANRDNETRGAEPSGAGVVLMGVVEVDGKLAVTNAVVGDGHEPGLKKLK